MDISIIFSVAILILSVVIHEVAHGYAALVLGDVTAKYAGRLTMNPLKHIDPFGSVIFPFLMAMIAPNFVFGWAKPVPYNPYNLRNKRWGELLVAIAGPISNILLAILMGIVVRFGPMLGLPGAFYELAGLTVIINIYLAVFNMMPIPPLDGSKVLFALFPESAEKLRNTLERYGIFFLLIFIFFLSSILSPVVEILARLILDI
jgi:Zn-dependent protease